MDVQSTYKNFPQDALGKTICLRMSTIYNYENISMLLSITDS